MDTKAKVIKIMLNRISTARVWTDFKGNIGGGC